MAQTTTVMQVRVRTGDGPAKPVNIDKNATIKTLKQEIMKATNIPLNKQTLMLAGFTDNDDNRTVGQYIQRNALLHVNQKGPEIQRGGSGQNVTGHMFMTTTAIRGSLHQGTHVENGYNGTEPRDRAKHKYDKTKDVDSNLSQGDLYQADRSFARATQDILPKPQSRSSSPQSPSFQGERYLPERNGGARANGPRQQGNLYHGTFASNTQHRQGDMISSSFSGSAPAGAGGDVFMNTVSRDGSLLQGNLYGPQTGKK
ncbi:hypothetical protein N0V92_002292 [Colletotrichum tropicale]|nr:hypothetical protein N0V92_002292 [Colletotrichum tropicale]